MKNTVLMNILGIEKSGDNVEQLSTTELELALDMMINYRSKTEMEAEALFAECDAALGQVEQLNMLAVGVAADDQEKTTQFVSMMNSITGTEGYTVESAKEVAGKVVNAIKEGLLRLFKALQAVTKLAVKALVSYSALTYRITAQIYTAVFEVVGFTFQAGREVYLALSGNDELKPGFIASSYKKGAEFQMAIIPILNQLSSDFSNLDTEVDKIAAEMDAWIKKVASGKEGELKSELKKSELDAVAKELDTAAKVVTKNTEDVEKALDGLAKKVAAAKEGEISADAAAVIKKVMATAKDANDLSKDTMKGSIAVVGTAAKAAKAADTSGKAKK